MFIVSNLIPGKNYKINSKNIRGTCTYISNPVNNLIIIADCEETEYVVDIADIDDIKLSDEQN